MVIIEGDISQDTEDKIMAMGAASGSLDKFGSGNKTFFHIKDDDIDVDDGNIDIDMDSFDDGALLQLCHRRTSCSLPRRRSAWKPLLADKGKVTGVAKREGRIVRSECRAQPDAGRCTHRRSRRR